MAVMTKAVNKPFYVVAESFKFVRLYPLNQEDVPNRFKVSCFKRKSKTTEATTKTTQHANDAQTTRILYLTYEANDSQFTFVDYRGDTDYFG